MLRFPSITVSFGEPDLMILLACDEWLPNRGGISTVNRALAVEFADQGHRVACLVESATVADQVDTAVHGMRLIVAEHMPAGPNLLLPNAEVSRLRPDVLIGHDRITGEVA